jgi:beta-phosphoglucomutase
MARAVIFDFDGVIVHSEPLHLRAIREVLKPLGVSFTDETYYARYVAFSDRDLIPSAAKDSGIVIDPSRVGALIDDKWAVMKAIVAREGLPAFPPTLALIRELHARRVPMALCTAATRRDVDHAFEKLDIGACFAAIVAVDDVTRSKPDPEPYRVACARLGQEPPHCVAIEDTPGGLASALGAGCLAVGVGHTVALERLAAATRVVRSSAEVSADELLAM